MTQQSMRHQKNISDLANTVNNELIYGFLLIFNSNISPNYAPLRDIKFQILDDLDFDLSTSLKIKCDSTVELPIYGFLIIFNSNMPN